MFFSRSYVNALQRQIDDLKQRLSESDIERKYLLDRLLEKNNYQPIRQSAAESTPQPPSLQIISPYNSIPLEAQDAIRESWIREEADYLVNQAGLDEARARIEAEARWRQENTPIN